MKNIDAYSYIIRLLSKRAYSEHKLRTKLAQRTYSEEEIDLAIEKIKEKNFLQEDLFTEGRIKSLMQKNYSKDYILQKLESEYLNVNMDQINDVFIEYKVNEDDQINLLLDKKIAPKDLSQVFDDEAFQRQKAKLLRFIVSKGHEISTASNLIEKKLKNHTN